MAESNTRSKPARRVEWLAPVVQLHTATTAAPPADPEPAGQLALPLLLVLPGGGTAGGPG